MLYNNQHLKVIDKDKQHKILHVHDDGVNNGENYLDISYDITNDFYRIIIVCGFLNANNFCLAFADAFAILTLYDLCQ